MSINYSITVFSDQQIEQTYSRTSKGNDFGTKDACSLMDFIAYFLSIEVEDLKVIKYSPFGKHIQVEYKAEGVLNNIVMVWEHIQD